MNKGQNKESFYHWLYTGGNIGGQERFTIFIHDTMRSLGFDSSLYFTDKGDRVSYTKKVLGKEDVETYKFSTLSYLNYIRKNKPNYLLHYCNKTIYWSPLVKILSPKTVQTRYFGHGFRRKKSLRNRFLYSFISKMFFPTNLTFEKGKKNLTKKDSDKVFQYFGVEIRRNHPPRI